MSSSPSDWHHEIDRLNRLSQQLKQQAEAARHQADTLRSYKKNTQQVVTATTDSQEPPLQVIHPSFGTTASAVSSTKPQKKTITHLSQPSYSVVSTTIPGEESLGQRASVNQNEPDTPSTLNKPSARVASSRFATNASKTETVVNANAPTSQQTTETVVNANALKSQPTTETVVNANALKSQQTTETVVNANALKSQQTTETVVNANASTSQQTTETVVNANAPTSQQAHGDTLQSQSVNTPKNFDTVTASTKTSKLFDKIKRLSPPKVAPSPRKTEVPTMKQVNLVELRHQQPTETRQAHTSLRSAVRVVRPEENTKLNTVTLEDDIQNRSRAQGPSSLVANRNPTMHVVTRQVTSPKEAARTLPSTSVDDGKVNLLDFVTQSLETSGPSLTKEHPSERSSILSKVKKRTGNVPEKYINKSAVELYDDVMGVSQHAVHKDGQNPNSAHVVLEDGEWSKNTPSTDDQRRGSMIIARSIDRQRDQRVGISLSDYNLNYMFENAQKAEKETVAFHEVFKNIDVKYLPASVDLRNKEGHAVFDQQSLGAAVACAVALTSRFVFDFTPSRLALYYVARQDKNIDSGVTIRQCLDAMLEHGVCKESAWTYIVRRFNRLEADLTPVLFQYYRLRQRVDEIKKSLKDGYPVVFGIALYDSFMEDEVTETGHVPIPNYYHEKRIGNHCMTIVGYDDSQSHFIVANSWGEKWGDKGHCYISYGYMMDPRWAADFYTMRPVV